MTRRASGLWAAMVLALGARPAEEEIDRQIAARAGGPVAARSTDAEFLRRAWLDLAGIIPAADETRRFLSDANAAKREKLVDRLLSSPDFARRMEEAFTAILLERHANDAVPMAGWRAYLRQSFAENKPWDRLVRELVAGDVPGSLKFLIREGKVDAHQATRDVGRFFLGMNLLCAQCHDHPTIPHYRQADYYGLFAYMSQTKLYTDPKTKSAALVEDPMSRKVPFQSVFTGSKGESGPRLPDGQEVPIPSFEKGQEYEVPPGKDKTPGLPKFRPRQVLSRDLPAQENSRFARAAVNRFWALLMGRGLVQPLDLDHPDNPPSHPELLDALARDFASEGFDVRRLVRRIVLSEVYQRSSRAPDGADMAALKPQSYRTALPKPLSPEQLTWSLLRATGNLEEARAAPAGGAKFSAKDYLNGRSEPPTNLPDTQDLLAAVFGNPPGQPEVAFEPTAEQALFLMNDRLVGRWLEPRKGNLADRLQALADPAAVAEELYLGVLTRLPDEAEKSEVRTHLERHKDRRAPALADLAWGLLASAEFRLNH